MNYDRPPKLYEYGFQMNSDEHDISHGAPWQAYRKVNSYLKAQYRKITGTELEIPHSSRPRRDFEKIVNAIVVLFESSKTIKNDFEFDAESEDFGAAEAEILETMAGQFFDVFSLDDFSINEVKKFILDEIKVHIREMGHEPLDLTKLFQRLLENFAKKAKISAAPRVGRNRHSFPIFRALRELENSPIGGKSTYFYISRATGGRVPHSPAAPTGLVLRFYDE